MKETTVVSSEKAIKDTLDSKLQKFLSTIRVGVDFGEAAGGIAVVQGNKILHAETYIDFHDATLEERRKLRRARRTRHAKKMRLARLRSWVLRQEIPSSIPGARLKNGKAFLPDPYEILKDRRYWVQPDIYQMQGKDPLKASTWLKEAKEGKVDARGFVRALTLIFKKRGYKYDDQELEELSDKALEEFLNSCAELNKGGEMKDSLKELVDQRGSPKLEKAYQAALNRPPEPRKALPRQIKEEDLKQVITAFGKRYHLDENTIARWKLNLAGGVDPNGKRRYGLLNRVLRAARFDNRLRSCCSWCDKNTPRLKKYEIRKMALEAAVGNIRVYWNEFTKRTRPLTDKEKQPFFDWFSKQEQKAKFQKGSKVPVTEREPSRENISKYLEKLRATKRPLRDATGKWRFDFPMLAQLTDLLNRVPKRGRAKLCLKHLKMAAQGGFLCNRHPYGICKQEPDGSHTRLDEAKADPGRRKAPNPKREQHDARVLNRLERILFIPGEKGERAWRFGPVSFITLEIPVPQTEHVKKGEETERKVDTLRQRLHQETNGKCIYCGETISVERTELDHIVPRARNGPDIQMNRIASCKRCNHPDTGKGDKLPREWLSGKKWEDFENRVKALKLPPFKEELLLLEKGADFPDDPTPLARVGGRTGFFTHALQELFKKYEVEPPLLAYVNGKPHIQIVRGEWTSRLRKSWLFKDKEAKQPNFPEKDRSDLYNHAQDAVLLSATPPHTWRNQIFCEQAVRPCVVRKDGKIVTDENGRPTFELRKRPAVALLSLAPDWESYMKTRERPLVRVLGKFKITWKRRFMDLLFYQNPKDLKEKFLHIHKPPKKPAKGGQRRKTQKVPIGGLVINVPHRDGTTGVRKVQVKPAHIAAVLWRNEKGKLIISRERIKPIKKFVSDPFDPPLPASAAIIGRLKKDETIWIDNCFYRVKEFPKGGVTVIPENAIPDALADALNIPKKERKKPQERTLRANKLYAYFEAVKQRQNAPAKPITE